MSPGELSLELVPLILFVHLFEVALAVAAILSLEPALGLVVKLKPAP